MIAKIGKKEFEVYAMDFETHNDKYLLQQFENNPEHSKTSIWLGYLIDEKATTWREGFFYSMEEFFERLSSISKPTREKRAKRILIYDFNLSFEWNFMLYYIKKHNFTFKEKFEDDDVNVYNSITNKSISSVWEVRLKLHKGDSVIILRDLNKILLSGSLRKLAKSFQLETKKGEIDYQLNRRFYQDDNDFIHYYDDYDPYSPTPEEMNYCFKDVRIIIEILDIMIKREDKHFFNSISAASYSASNMIDKGFNKTKHPYTAYRKLYPELDEEETEFLRNSVAGGICYPTPKYQFREINQPILHVDAHQMHPTQMYSKKFPYGKGDYLNLEKYDYSNESLKRGYLFKNRISCVRMKITYESVKLHSIISLIGIDKVIIPLVITVWDFEIPVMMKCYNNLKIKILEAYVYKSMYLPFKELVAENYNKRLEAKRCEDGFGIIYYKLLNNSFYGKLLEKPHNTIFINDIIDGVANSYEEQKDDFKINAKYTYIPVGSCIPAYSRCQLLELALAFGWQNVIYFDTDSIFAIYTPKVKKVWDMTPQEDFLCNWGLEEISKRGQFTAPKRYKLEGEKTIIHAAGLNTSLFNEKSFDDANIVEEDYLIKRGYKIKGGMIVANQLKRISVPDKYKFIYESWRNSNGI